MSNQLVSLLDSIPLSPLENGEQPDINNFIVENGTIPSDYSVMFLNYHGGAGNIGKAYIDLWDPSEIASSNRDYQTNEFAPGFTIFGSDGGDVAFAFERNTGFIYHFPFIGMTIDEPATFISKTFEDFLSKISLGFIIIL